MYFSLFKETKNFDFYCMFFSAVCVAQGYHITVLSYTQAGIITTELPTKNGTLNLLLSCPTKHETPACV